MRALVGAYLRNELVELPRAEAKPPQPSAAAISRKDAVLQAWHHSALSDYGDWRRLRGALYARAAGIKSGAIYSATGISRQRLSSAKQRAMLDMVDYINRLTNGQFRA